MTPGRVGGGAIPAGGAGAADFFTPFPTPNGRLTSCGPRGCGGFGGGGFSGGADPVPVVSATGGALGASVELAWASVVAPCQTFLATACPNPSELPLDVVVSEFNNGPIEGATVVVSGPIRYEAQTDSGGVAHFFVVPGVYEAEASKLGFHAQPGPPPVVAIPPTEGVCHNTTGFTLERD